MVGTLKERCGYCIYTYRSYHTNSVKLFIKLSNTPNNKCDLTLLAWKYFSKFKSIVEDFCFLKFCKSFKKSTSITNADILFKIPKRILSSVFYKLYLKEKIIQKYSKTDKRTYSIDYSQIRFGLKRVDCM